MTEPLTGPLGPDAWQIWMNPRCGSSRKALELLHQQGIAPEVRLYLQQCPTAAELVALLELLKIPARQLLRSQEPVYLEEGLQDASLGSDIVLAAIVRHPVLLQRPIVLRGSRGMIARPPERLLELVDPS